MVTDVDNDGLIIKEKDGTLRRIESQCKVWSAGVQASPLGKQLVEQSGGETDRAGRVMVNPDLSLPGHPNVFGVIGDMMSLDKLPGLAQVAMQVQARDQPTDGVLICSFRSSTSTRAAWQPSRASVVAKVGKLEISGLSGGSPGWQFTSCTSSDSVHAHVVVGSDVLRAWPCPMASTEQQVFGWRNAMGELEKKKKREHVRGGASNGENQDGRQATEGCRPIDQSTWSSRRRAAASEPTAALRLLDRLSSSVADLRHPVCWRGELAPGNESVVLVGDANLPELLVRPR